jgi:hypothetical protein
MQGDIVTYLDKHVIAVNISNFASKIIIIIHQKPQRMPLHQAKKDCLCLSPIRLLNFWCIYPPKSYFVLVYKNLLIPFVFNNPESRVISSFLSIVVMSVDTIEQIWSDNAAK